MPWYDENLTIASVTLLGVGIFWRQLHHMAKRNEFDVRERAGDILGARFSKIEGGAARFYDMRHHFKAPGERKTDPAANPAWGRGPYREAMQRRLEIVADLDPAERRADLLVVEPVVNALNDLAELIDLNFLEAPLVLSKYHLALAREVFLLEPYILYEVLLADRGRWGYRVLRLGEMARKYNDMNPVHRRPIYFLDGTQPDRAFGAIYPAPESGFLWALRAYWLLRRRLFGYPTITEWVKRRQNRQMLRLEGKVHQFRHDRELATGSLPAPTKTNAGT